MTTDRRLVCGDCGRIGSTTGYPRLHPDDPKLIVDAFACDTCATKPSHPASVPFSTTLDRLLATGAKPRGHVADSPASTPATPRERGPQVWAAAYGTAYVEAYREAFCITDGPREDRLQKAHTFVDVAQCKTIADAAVMALHGETLR